MQRTSGIVSKPLAKIDNNPKKGKRIVISGTVASRGEQESVGLDIRHYYRDRESGDYLPTQRGVFLSKDDLMLVLTELGFNPADLDPRYKAFFGDDSVEHIPMLRI